MGNTLKKRSQWVWISIIIVVTGILAGAVLWGSKAETTENAEQEHAHQENEKEGTSVSIKSVLETETLSNCKHNITIHNTLLKRI